jgi:3'(2'), 5'-bisphosphate nucleotidase
MATGAELLALLPQIEALARQAGEVILAVYASDFTVERKADASPVTLADEAAERLIVPALHALTPDWPVVAEEAHARGEAPGACPIFWLVDPLDGTREFVSRNGEFTVNIALVQDGLPVLGVVHVPVTDTLYAGVVGEGAWRQIAQGQRQPIGCRAVPASGLAMACSRAHGDEAALASWMQGHDVASRLAAGSSLKFGLLAAGQADVYPRFGRTMEWDTAAGHAVLRAAGGEVTTLDDLPLRYGKPGFENADFIAWGARSSGRPGA